MAREFTVEAGAAGSVIISIANRGHIDKIIRLDIEEFLQLLQIMSKIRDQAIISKDEHALDIIRGYHAKINEHKSAIKEAEEKIALINKQREDFQKQTQQYDVRGDHRL